MKKYIIRTILLFSIIISPFFSEIVNADPPIPPAPGTNGFNPGDNTNAVGAPIDSGLIVILLMAGMYGVKKIVQAKKGREEQIPEQ